jgi:ribosome-associated toxin RatA of RatAB toxin-antitoxin module
MGKSILVYLLSYCLLLYSVPCMTTMANIELDWDRLFSGDIIVDAVSSRESIPGVRLIMAVKASRERIWDVLTDYQHFRSVFKDIEELKVLEQNREGAQVEFWIDAVIAKYHYILYRHYEKPQWRLTWKRVSGDMKRIEGSWEIHDTSRPGIKLLMYESYVQVGGAIPVSLLRWGAMRKARAMGVHLRKTLERLPSKD